MHYCVEFTGGFGDFVIQAHRNKRYMTAAHLPAEDTCTAAFWGENPHIGEVFKWCPASARISTCTKRYDFHNDPETRREFGLCEIPFTAQPGPTHIKPVWYPSIEDWTLIRSIRCPFVLISPSASTDERMFPKPILEAIVDYIAKSELTPVVIGRNFPAWNAQRQELHPSENSGAIDMVDKITCPGALKLVELAAGCIVTESAIMHASWHERKPTLLLYGAKTQELHFDVNSAYVYGKDYPESICIRFEEFTDDAMDRFLNVHVQRMLETHLM